MSNALLEMITQQLGGDRMKEMSQRLGADEATTEKAVGAALPSLLAALGKNASRPEEAAKIHEAIARDHDGSVFSNLSGLIQNPKGGAGDGILKHVLGGRREKLESGLSRATGMKNEQTSDLMSMLAPMVMGAVGKQQRESKCDVNALAGFLGREREQVQKSAPKSAGMIDKLLDTDDDGDLDFSDMLQHGKGMLGKLFAR